MTALRRTEKEKTDYEKPEDRHPVTDPPTQKNETMQTQPCNLNICLCKKNEPPHAQNLQILLPITDEGLKAWRMLV